MRALQLVPDAAGLGLAARSRATVSFARVQLCLQDRIGRRRDLRPEMCSDILASMGEAYQSCAFSLGKWSPALIADSRRR